MKKYIFLLLVLVLTTTFWACKKGAESAEQSIETDAHDTHDEHDAHDEHDEQKEGVHLSEAQIKTIGLEFGELSNIKINDFVKETGTLGLPPSGYASVTAKAAGIISGSKMFVEGNAIKKGAIIGFIENPDFIIKQQEYLEAKANYKLKSLALERQKKLFAANAGVSKNLQNAEAEVAIYEAKSAGLARQLSYLGIGTDNLSPTNIRQKIPIYSPMKGYITSINLHDGMYAQPTQPLMEILSDGHLHLELDVFEQDVAKIKIGQKITYAIPALGQKEYQGEVSIIGKEFDTNTKTIRIHGHLEGERPIFLKDLFINARIWLNDETARAVPESAVIKEGPSFFVYVGLPEQKSETSFTKIPVIPSVTSNGFTSIKLLEEIPEGMKIVTKGAYYVSAQGKAGELEHEH